MIININKSNSEILSARLNCIKEKAELLLPYVEELKQKLADCCESTCLAIFVLSGEYMNFYYVTYAGSFNGFPEFAGQGMTIKIEEENFRYYYVIRVNGNFVSRSLDPLSFGQTPNTVNVWGNQLIANQQININFCYGGEVPEPPTPPVNPCEWDAQIFISSDCVDFNFQNLQLNITILNAPGYFQWAYVGSLPELNIVLAYNIQEERFDLLNSATLEVIGFSERLEFEDICNIPDSFTIQIEECEATLDSACADIEDPDAMDWIERVELRDDEELECPIKRAMEDLVLELKAANEWDSLDYLLVYGGARTLDGAMSYVKTPSGAAPTYTDFDSSQYNRRTGVKGNGINSTITNKPYIISNQDRQWDNQLWCYLTEPDLEGAGNGTNYFRSEILRIDTGISGRGLRIALRSNAPLISLPNHYEVLSWGFTRFYPGATNDSRFVGICRKGDTTKFELRANGSTVEILADTVSKSITGTGRSQTFYDNNLRAASRIFAEGAGSSWQGNGSAIETAIKNYLDKLAVILP